MGFHKVFGWFALLWLAPAVALAGGTAHFVSDGATVVVEFDGKGAMRIEEVGQSDAFMIMREGKLYSVAYQGSNPMVIEIGGAMAMMSTLGDGMMFNQDAEEIVSFRNTGHSETVAGLRGQVYEMTFIDKKGVHSTEVMVLSKDRTVHEMTKTMAGMSDALMGAVNAEKSADELLIEEKVIGKGYGVLRYGDDFALSHIDSNQPASSRFDLPAEPMDLSGMSSFMQGMQEMQNAQQAQEQQREEDPGFVEKKAERQSNRAKRRTEKEIDRTTDKAVDKVFKKLFGG